MNELEKTNPYENRNIDASGKVIVEAIYKGAQEERAKQSAEFYEWLGEIRKPDEQMENLMTTTANHIEKEKEEQAEKEIKERMAQAKKKINQEVIDKYNLEDEKEKALRNTLKGLFNDK